MKQISYQVHINASTQKVWDILADFGGVYKYNPGVTSSHPTSANNEGLDARRHCDLRPSGSIEERVIEWHEGESYVVEIYEGKGTPPFKKAIAKLSVKPDGAGTIAAITFDYSLKYGPIGAIMDSVMVGPFLNKAFQGLLSGLKHHAETGEEVQSAKGLQFVATPA